MALATTMPPRPLAARRRIAALTAALGLFAALGPPAAASEAPHVPDARLLVGWRPGTSPADKAQTAEAAGAVTVERLDELAVDVVTVEGPAAAPALARLRADADVAYAEPDQQVRAAAVPTDPLWGDQWGPVLTRATAAWDTTVGNPAVVIAVLDSGVDHSHPDLIGALVAGTDVINGDSNPADDFGHGTAVAAVAAARAGNEGIAGYCWTCSVMPVKVLDQDGLGTLSAVAAGVTFAADRGAEVINLSLSSPAPSVTMANAVAYARARGVIVVAAAGNDGDAIPNYPAGAPGVVGIAATDTADRRYRFTSFGPWAELSAPGCHPSARLGGGHEAFCGTSSAAPAVAGIAGLLLAARPSASPAEVERALLLTTAAVGAGTTAAYGRVDAGAAMAHLTAPATVPVPGATVPGAPTSVTATAGNGSVTVRWSPPPSDGGSQLTGYRVSASPGGAAADVRPGASSFTLAVANGVGYSLGVSAVNALGPGPAAAAPPPLARPVVTMERVAGAGRIETAVALSQRAFRGADGVVVARADDYADALTAAPLAGLYGEPLLLSAGDQLPAVVAAEVRRLGATFATIVGGPAAVSPEVEAGLRAAGIETVERAHGVNRFDTARLLAEMVGGDSVYVTEGAHEDPNRGWPDAVAVSGLAAFQQRPILLATRDDLPAETREALADLGATSATVVGGTAAVSQAVASALADPDQDGTAQVAVTRVAGATRWETSRLLADRALASGAGAHRLWLATGRDWPDALAAGPAAAAKAAVVLLVDGQDLASSPPAVSWLTLQNRRFLEAVLVGGTASLAPQVETALASLLR